MTAKGRSLNFQTADVFPLSGATHWLDLAAVAGFGRLLDIPVVRLAWWPQSGHWLSSDEQLPGKPQRVLQLWRLKGTDVWHVRTQDNFRGFATTCHG